MRKVLFFFSLIYSICQATESLPEPPKIGNFALPSSQQPAALVGFGGNIIDAGEVQVYFFADDFEGHSKRTIDLMPGVLFGITDTCSIFFNFPYTPAIQDGRGHTSGPEDFYVQGEYTFYNKKTAFYSDEATFVANVTVPIGSALRKPPTGFGSPSFFIGGHLLSHPSRLVVFYFTWCHTYHLGSTYKDG